MENPCCQICDGKKTTKLERRVISNSDFPELKKDASYYIWLCEECGYVFQTTDLSDEDLENYYQKYAFNFSIGESPNIATLVQTERLEKAKKRFEFIQPYLKPGEHTRLLEIGCGDGKLLSLFRGEGVTLLGSELNRAHHGACKSQGIEIVELGPDFVDPKIQKGVDAIFMSHVLEHIPNPKEFLDKLRGFMSGSHSLLFIEVPDEMQVASPNNFSLEHVSYFFQPVLAKLIQDCGFEILVQERVRYETTPPSLRFLCVPKEEQSLSLLLDSYRKDLDEKMSTFKAAFQSKRIAELKQKKVALFGGGGYAIDLIQLSDLKPEVIFDNNPSKAGASLAGVLIQPVSKADDYVFDTLIITSWGSANEMERQLSTIPRFQNVEIIKIRSLLPEKEAS